LQYEYGCNGKNCEIEWDICSLPWGNMGISLHILYNGMSTPDRNCRLNLTISWTKKRQISRLQRKTVPEMSFEKKERSLNNSSYIGRSEIFRTFLKIDQQNTRVFPKNATPKKDRKGSIYHNLSLLSSVFLSKFYLFYGGFIQENQIKSLKNNPGVPTESAVEASSAATKTRNARCVWPCS
jgi:hypothetical protein